MFPVGCLRLGSVLLFLFTLREGACVLEGACVSCRVLALGVGFDFSVGGKEVGVMVGGGPERICVLNGGRMARARWGWTSNGGGSGLGGALVCIEKCLALGP